MNINKCPTFKELSFFNPSEDEVTVIVPTLNSVTVNLVTLGGTKYNLTSGTSNLKLVRGQFIYLNITKAKTPTVAWQIIPNLGAQQRMAFSKLIQLLESNVGSILDNSNYSMIDSIGYSMQILIDRVIYKFINFNEDNKL